MPVVSQREYWDKKIREWTFASYGKNSRIGVIEKIATYFRSVNKRKDAALKLIGPIARGKTILDLGCGLGEFAFAILRYDPKKVLAYDISDVAIQEVKKSAKKLKTKNKIEFKTCDVSTLKQLPSCDIVVGLGFIDYLNPTQLKKLFKLIGNKPYLFSFFQKSISLFTMLHKIYVTIQSCPGAYKYSRAEIKKFIPKGSKIFFLEQDGLLFISNSPKIAKPL
ncbi:class I SAM-dependent methyltransferase [Candidatus Roizmanbacteria bacterium]|nr:class I SAM-dependent methyltransferase [Candidatus Roizmanbacteria bacterium]